MDAATGREFTYARFNERASRLAEFLRDGWQIQAGDRVAILAHNSSDYMEILFGCAKIGAILIPLNWRLATPELAYVVGDGTPRALIFDAEFAGTAAALLSHIDGGRQLTLGDEPPPGGPTYEAALAAASGRTVEMPPRGLDEVWYILYTAGTTGRPKGVLQTFGMALFNWINIGQPIDLTSQDATLHVLPFFHTGGLNLYTLPTIQVGGTAIIQRTFDATTTLHLLATRATAFFGVPAVYLFLSQHPDFDRTDLSALAAAIAGQMPGSVRSTKRLLWEGQPHLAERLEAERRRFVQQIGTAEAARGMAAFLQGLKHG